MNGGLDAFTPAGGAVPLVNMFVGEVIFGGDGSGPLLDDLHDRDRRLRRRPHGRQDPEYLGKKIEAREIKLASLGALFPPVLALVLTAVAIATNAGLASLFNSEAHGFTEALYAWTSMVNTNGSAFAGYGGTSFSASLGAVAMLFGRIVPMFAALALAGAVSSEAHRAGLGRDVPDGRADVLHPARGDHPARRRLDDPAGADAWPDRRGAFGLRPPFSCSVKSFFRTGAAIFRRSSAAGSYCCLRCTTSRHSVSRRPASHSPT